MVKIMVGVVVAAVLAIVVFMVIDPNVEKNGGSIIDTSNTISESIEGMSVTIEGEVNKTGSYVVSDDATLSDLIEAAGGITDNADVRAYYDDAEIISGETYYIASLYDTTNVCSLVVIDKVNINTDDFDKLTSITVITPTIADKIISYRTENGNFRHLEDIEDIYGIGPATYRKLRPYFILHE